MLIYLTDKILEPGISNYTRSDLVTYLSNILRSFIESKHIVLANIRTLETYHQVEEIKELSHRSKLVLNAISREYTNNGIKLKRDMPCYVQVVEPSKSDVTITTKNQRTIIDIPIWYFEDSEACQKTVLIGENLNDAELFIHLVKAYLTTKKSFRKAQFKIQATPRGGGGSTIKPVLDKQCRSRTFCLAIADTDCVAPGTAFGDTAKGLGLSQKKQQEWQNISKQSNNLITIKNDSAIAKAFVFKGKKIENLIPTHLIENSLPKDSPSEIFDKIDKLKEWETHYPSGEWRKFIEFKKGLCGYDIYKWGKDSKSAKYWLDFMQRNSFKLKNECEHNKDCKEREKCKCVLWAGLGDNTLSQVVKHMDKETSHKIAEFFAFENDDSLIELADEILMWCCALEHVHV